MSRKGVDLSTKTIAAAAVAAIIGVSGAAAARCPINITIVNQERGTIEVLNGARSETAARAYRGGWRKLRAGGWFRDVPVLRIEPYRSRSDVYRADLGCNVRRFFRIEYRCAGTRRRRAVDVPESGWPPIHGGEITVRLNHLNCGR